MPTTPEDFPNTHRTPCKCHYEPPPTKPCSPRIKSKITRGVEAHAHAHAGASGKKATSGVPGTPSTSGRLAPQGHATVTCTRGLNTTRSMAQFGSLRRLEISSRFCMVAAEMAGLAESSPGLEALSLTVTEPLGPRWLGRGRQQLGLHAGSGVRLPQLQSLSLSCVPVASLRLASSALPSLRHLRLSCSGFLLTQQPYENLSLELPRLEALEVAEVAVWSHVDLGACLGSSPCLRVVSLSELWVLSPIYNANGPPHPRAATGTAPDGTRDDFSFSSSGRIPEMSHEGRGGGGRERNCSNKSSAGGGQESNRSDESSAGSVQEGSCSHAGGGRSGREGSRSGSGSGRSSCDSSGAGSQDGDRAAGARAGAGVPVVANLAAASEHTAGTKPDAAADAGGGADAGAVSIFVHELNLPACRVFHVRNSINALGFELWAPKLEAAHVLCAKLHRLRLMVPHPLPPGGMKPAQVTLLRGKVDADTQFHLKNTRQVGGVAWDDEAAVGMAASMEVLRQSVHGLAV
ncbi:hypothetical protein FOA52_011056 [Chlamydomonas sp. UWO 241]|nr:hypothetical protein FOA52_011056 [Chlamydomonas sp. UWO 241]